MPDCNPLAKSANFAALYGMGREVFLKKYALAPKTPLQSFVEQTFAEEETPYKLAELHEALRRVFKEREHQ